MAGKLDDLMRKMEAGKAKEALTPSLPVNLKASKKTAEKQQWKKNPASFGGPIAKKRGSGKH